MKENWHDRIAAGESQTLESKASFDKASMASLVWADSCQNPGRQNYRSSLRNKLIAEGFYLVNAIEKYGSGFIRIRRALHDYPEVQFDVEEKFGGVMVTFAQKNRPADSGAPQVTPQAAPQVTPQVEQLLAVIQGEMTRQELMAALELKDRKHFANTYLKPALAAGAIEMTLPDKPSSGLQKYRKAGLRP